METRVLIPSDAKPNAALIGQLTTLRLHVGLKRCLKFETLRREIKADIRKQHDLYVNNLVGDVKANPKDFYRYINSQKKDAQGIPPLKKRNGSGAAQPNPRKQQNSMVSSLMYSLNPNTVRSLFWIDQPLSWKIFLLLRKELQNC